MKSVHDRILIRTLAVAMLLMHAGSASAASDAYQKTISDSAPVLWFQLNETGPVAFNQGSLGVGYNADYLGTPSRAAPSEAGDKSVAFNGADDYLQTDAVAPENLGGNPTFSAEALYFLPPDGTAALWAPLLHWGDSSATPTMKSVYFSFQHDNPTRIYAGFYNGGLRTSADISRGAWHHVVWIRTGGGLANAGTTLYVDGVSMALENDPDLPADSGTPNVINTEFRINRAQDFTRYFFGSLDEVALYDRELTAKEVQEHYEAVERCPEKKCIDYDGGCKFCGVPAGTGEVPKAADALAVLRSAVGARRCNFCICDVDNSGSLVATDALIVLKIAVGQNLALGCPAAA